MRGHSLSRAARSSGDRGSERRNLLSVRNVQPLAAPQIMSRIRRSEKKITFTFMHLADAFIQSDLQCIQSTHLYCQYVCSLGIEPTIFALLTQCSNHWATGTLLSSIMIDRALPSTRFGPKRWATSILSWILSPIPGAIFSNMLRTTLQTSSPSFSATPCNFRHHL